MASEPSIPAFGYALNGYSWPAGTTVLMQLSLGSLPPGTVLQDGFTSWNASAADALALWNQYITIVKFGWNGSSTISPRGGDHQNSVFFSSNIYGQSFGSSTLAVTLHFNDNGNLFTETDTIFNSAWTWNSYRGPLRFDRFGKLAPDFHRVALHEFGHTLGLAHPDQAGQNVSAIMNSTTSNIDSLQPDDIAGAQWLYAPRITSPLDPPPTRQAAPFRYQITTNFSATTFFATGLPAGIVLNSSTGLISGTPSVAGTFPVTIGASSVLGKAAATLHLVITAPQITSNLSPPPAVIGQFYEYQISADNDPSSFGATGLPPGLTLNSSLGLILGTPTVAGSYAVPITAYSVSGNASATLHLVILAGVITSDNTAPPLNAGDRLYYQITATNQPTSFSAVGLPSGLTVDPTTGIISGNTGLSGSFVVRLIAHGAAGDASGSLTITVRPAPPPPTAPAGVLKWWPITATHLVYDSPRSRVYASDPFGGAITVLDAADLSVVRVLTPRHRPRGISLSADGSKLWYAGDGWIGAIDLQSFSELLSLDVQHENLLAVVEAADGSLYGSDTVQLFHFDARTGAEFHGFFEGGLLALAPDRRTLFTSIIGSGPTIKQYDISRPTPVLVAETDWLGSDSPIDLKVSHDGSSLCLANPLGTQHSWGPVQTALLPTSNIRYIAGNFMNGVAVGAIAFSSDDSTFYQGAGTASLEIQVFNIATFARIGSISLGPASDSVLSPKVDDMVVDKTDSRIFVATSHWSPANYISAQRDVRVYDTGRGTRPPPTPAPVRVLSNISTRAQCLSGTGNLIAGFIIHGSDRKRVLIRAIGPSLTAYHVAGVLANPLITLYDAAGKAIGSNDNWNTDRATVLASGLPPANETEAALVAELSPGAYTVVVQGYGNTTGVALVELYDLQPAKSALANLSTRGYVGTGDNVLIGGFIVGGSLPARVVVRALGPTLAQYHVGSTLADPMLEVHDAHGTLILSNDNWRSAQAASIQALGYAPAYESESVIAQALSPGNYTAIVRGKNNSTGVALVEMYNLDAH